MMEECSDNKLLLFSSNCTVNQELNCNEYMYELNDIYIPWEYLTPSEIQGMSELEEKKIRLFANEMIQEVGVVLKLPQTSIITSMSIFNRFYWKKSFQEFEPFYVICSSLLISTKLDEKFRRLRDVLSSCFYIFKRKERESSKIHSTSEKSPGIIEYESVEYNHLKANVISAEIHILRELGFNLVSLNTFPHKYLLHFIRKIKGKSLLLHKSWGYLNDMARTSLIVNYPPHVLATAAIFLASRKFYIPLPDVEWWEMYDTKYEQIEEICAETLAIYQIGKISLDEVRAILEKYKSKVKDESKLKHHKDKRHDKSKGKRKDSHSYRHSHHHHRHKHMKYSHSHSHSRSRSRIKPKHKRRKSSSNSSYSSSSS